MVEGDVEGVAWSEGVGIGDCGGVAAHDAISEAEDMVGMGGTELCVDDLQVVCLTFESCGYVLSQLYADGIEA